MTEKWWGANKALNITLACLLSLVSASLLRGQPPGQFKLDQRDNGRPIGLLTFTLAHQRLSPSTVTIVEGQYLIRFRNGELLDDVGFVLREPSKARSAKVDVLRRNGPRSAGIFQLDAGDYEVVVEKFPQWKATIVVEKEKQGGK